MVVELKIKKKNPWAGLIKYKSCFDYIAPYCTRSGSIYTGLTPEDEKYYEKALGYEFRSLFSCLATPCPGSVA